MFILSGVMVFLQLSTIFIIIPTVITSEKRSKWVSYTFMLSYITLLTTYASTVVYLKRTLNYMQQLGNFDSQQKDIILQFLFFLAGMASNLVL